MELADLIGGAATWGDELRGFLELLGLTFVPIFIALDALGSLPIILVWTAGLSPKELTRTLRHALITALGVGLAFIVAGRAVFLLLGITVNDFVVAGGLVLLTLAILDLITREPRESTGIAPGTMFGVVPIGTPILAGPATLTTILILSERYGLIPTAIALLLNMAIAWYLFDNAAKLTQLFGAGGLKAASKVISLLLAAIAIKFIREGIAAMLASYPP